MLSYLVQLFFKDNFEDEDNYNRYSVNRNNQFQDLIILYYQHKENIRLREIDLSSKLYKIMNDFENNNNTNNNNDDSSNNNKNNSTPNKRSTINLSSPLTLSSSSSSSTPTTLNNRLSTPDLNSIKKQQQYQENLLINQARNELVVKELKEQIEKAKILDQSLDYKKCLALYIESIEKLMKVYSYFKDSKDLRGYIDFYLKRAEYLKSELANNTNFKSITTFDNFQKQHQQQFLDYQKKQQQKNSNLISTIFSKPSLTQQSSSTLKIDQNNNNKTLTKSLSQSSISNNINNNSRKSISLLPFKSTNNNNNVNNNQIPEIKGIDKSIVSIIMNEILDRKNPVTWEDVVGLDKVKQSLMESVILPNLRPDIFTGLRAPPRGLLLFGPGGTGKSLIAKALAFESKVAFFSISASSLTSKYVGDGEKLARALFAVATHFQPSIIFIDEIDSLLTERSSNESEASRRLKTEILLQFDGVRTNGSERVLVMGATNRPEDLDEAALRRFGKRIYVGLPEFETRLQIIQHLLKGQNHSLSESQLSELANLTNGYSGSDLTSLCKDAAYEPIRRLGSDIKNLDLNEISSISFKDFRNSLKQIRPSVSSQSLKSYEKWNSKYGSI